MPSISETPSSIMYADLRTFGGINNKTAASLFLSDRIAAGGKSPRDRLESRTYLSREVVHVAPANVNPAIYGSFYASTQTICSRIRTRLGAQADDLIVKHYGGIAASQMCSSLESFGLNRQVYANECLRLGEVRLRAEHDRPLLLLMLFCITGCLANPQEAVRQVENFARLKLAQDLATVTVVPRNRTHVQEPDDAPAQLGLLRIEHGIALPPIMPLNPTGSLVGAHASGQGSISNVGQDVSRLHARIWLDGNRWLCEGLRSTNGTSIIRGSDQSIAVVEPPRTVRQSNMSFPPQQIHEGDVICFGGNTRFLVMRISG